MARKNVVGKKRGWIYLIVGIALIAAIAIGAVALISAGKIGGGGEVEVSASPVVTEDLRETLDNYRGKVVVLDFWATWCGPCRSEIPGLVALQDKYRDQGLAIVGVSLDPITGRGGAAAVPPFMKQYGINYNIFMVDNPSALAGYDVSRGIPTKYILDRQGRVVKSYVGARPPSVVENDIKPLL